MAKVEICVEDVMSAMEAERGGADRVELCSNMAVGGVSPGAGSVVITAGSLAIPVHVLIRPRGGDFVYTRSEFDVMESDIIFAKQWCAGVVVGMLTKKGRVNRSRTAELIAAARPMSVTFHKAFDAAVDPFEALDDLISIGVDRVLTSGHAPTAREGLDLLVALKRRAEGRIAIMAGGSIVGQDIPRLVEMGLDEVHVGSAASLGGSTRSDLVRQVVTSARAPLQIFHIATRTDWESLRSDGCYHAASIEFVGFIHASTAAQVAGSANRFFRGRSDLVLVRIDLSRIKPPVRWEDSPDSDRPFPHIHGPLNLDAVIGVTPFEPDKAGVFAWPPA